jgi:hypothetical protein
MAKRRKAVRRKARRPKAAARRRGARRKGSDDETLNIIAAILVVLLIGLGIYFYQINDKPAATGMTSNPPAASAPAPTAPK